MIQNREISIEISIEISSEYSCSGSMASGSRPERSQLNLNVSAAYQFLLSELFFSVEMVPDMSNMSNCPS